MSVQLAVLQKFLDEYLYFDRKIQTEKIDPYMANGLIVKGKEKVRKIGFGVSASLMLFKEAQKRECDVLIVHHAFNLPLYNRYDQIYQNRLGFLIQNKITLFGYHFLLDAHPEIGNNIQILKIIRAKKAKAYFYHDAPWGYIGEYEELEKIEKIEERLKPFLSQRSVIYPYGEQQIKKVVVVSGKGAPSATEMQDLIDEKIDLYLTGEVHEWNRELFREAKINFIAGGHYATEVFGIKALLEKVKNRFKKITVEWLDLPNSV